MRPPMVLRDKGLWRSLFFVCVLTALAGGIVSDAIAQTILLPETKAGWQAQWRDPMDVSEYLAFHKGKAVEQLRGAIEAGQTPDQELYDAKFYDLDLNLDPVTRILDGVVRIDAEVVTGPLTTLELDLDNLMTVSSVTSGGAATTYSHVADLLDVDLDRSYAAGEIVTLVVTYSGNPAGGGAFGWDSHAGEPMIWTLSEPYGARTWWPCKDYPIDKADSVNIAITVPTGMMTASNGTLVESTDNGTTATTRWEERYPITTYLVSIASHPFTVWSDWYQPAVGDPMEIQFYIFPDDFAETEVANLQVNDMIEAFVTRFGEYPFLEEKYGHAEFLWGGGMEHQTCTSLGYFGEAVIAHELGHQWWGDMISPETFHHIWLNEGFATYSEALWYELAYGPEAMHQDMSFNAFYGPGTIFVENPDDFGSIFDSNLSYAKASWVLHMLRHVIGDTDFFASLIEYRAQYEHSVATTEQFRDVCEQVSGQDLDDFFNEWIYGEYYPKYSYSFSSVPVAEGYDVSVVIEQTQTWQIFTMPIDVTITTAGGEETFVVFNSQPTEEFILHVAEEPTGLALDKDNWILRTISEPVINPPFDRGVLLVNGVSWDTYGSEILNAYEAEAFWGDYNVDFWDHFNEPTGGYPSTLPTPLGHGRVPADVIGHYRNVIWVGNNYAGDLTSWINTPILNYLDAGGNVLLMTRQGQDFLDDDFTAYLGVNWMSTGTIYDCVSDYTGLSDIVRTGTQSFSAMFFSQLTHPESSLLYLATQVYEPDRGIGVWRKPVAGGTYRPNGAQMVFLSGRPYRWDHNDLKTNVMYMLENFFEEPIDPTSVDNTGGIESVLRMEPARPNPLQGLTAIHFSLPRSAEVRLTIVDVNGRRVRGLAEGSLEAGAHVLPWDGRDDLGHAVPGGIYWATLESEGKTLSKKISVLR